MDRLKYIAGRLGLFVFFKKIFGPLLKRRKLKAFNNNKNGILQDLVSLSKKGARFFLAFGTYLGARRDGKIIPGDDDFDLGAFVDDFPELDGLFKAAEFKVKLCISRADGNPVLVKYIKDKVVVDIFIHYHDGDKIVCYDHVDINRTTSLMNEWKDKGHIALYENVFSTFGLETCQLEGNDFLSPDRESYLKEAYGRDYLVPDGNWTYTDRNIRKKSGIKGFFRHEQ